MVMQSLPLPRPLLLAHHTRSMRSLADWRSDPSLPGLTGRRKALEYARRHGRAGVLHRNGDYTEYRCPYINAQYGQRRLGIQVQRIPARRLAWI